MGDPIDITDHQQLRADREAAAKLAATERADDLRWLMSDRRGRRFVARLFADCGLQAGIWRASSEMPYLEGRRSVAVGLNDELRRAEFENHIRMQQENRT